MSGAMPDDPTMQSAQAVRTRAAAWLERRERGPWNDTDQAALEEWLSQSLSHRTAYWRVTDAWDRADRLRALSSPAHEQDAAAIKISIPKILAGAAAAIAVVAISGVTTVNYLLAPREQTYATAIGGHRTVALADGSRIELNTNTSLRVAMSADRRVVSLDKGEAFFEVRHDAQHPFMVMVGNRRVTDVGTKFVIRRDTDRLQVTVVEGRVRLDARDGSTASKPEMLKQGDVVVAAANSTSLMRETAQQVSNALSWRHGVLVFKHTTLEAAAAEFNRYNREKFVIADADTSRLKIDGTFPANNMKPFIEVAQDVFGLRVDNRGDQTVISR
jgi:transmembrane sensor